MIYHDFKTGDLIKVIDLCEQEVFIYRQADFPFGKVGIIVQTNALNSNIWQYHKEDIEPYIFAYDYYSFNRLWQDEDLIAILVHGRKWWVLPDEIELYTK